VPAHELNVPELVDLQKRPDDPLWTLPAVAFLRDGSVVDLRGRSLREAHEEVRRAGDSDIYIDGISADALRNLGVVLPEEQEAPPKDQLSPGAAAAGRESADKWAQVYVAACGEVMNAANACLAVANRAVGARSKIVEHQNDGLPGTPIAIRNFTNWAEEAEREFGPLYGTFDEACTRARSAAASLLAAGDHEEEAELALMLNFDESTLDMLAMAKAVLSTSYGPSPAAFSKGVQQSNEFMETVTDDGHIYRPPARHQSDERTCPWCAETIKAAAVICRFCGRDVQVQPNVG
jgi:hypothetical protein